jgi:hypothetical protein
MTPPTHDDVILEKQKILSFCEKAALRRDGGNVSYGGYQAPMSFTLWFEGPETVVINHVLTASAWERNGLFTFLLTQLESIPGVKNVGVKSAHAPAIQSIITKRGYCWHPDDDFIKTLRPAADFVYLGDLPSWIRFLVRQFTPSPRSEPYA